MAGAAENNFEVQWEPQLVNAWQTIATLPVASCSFSDNNLARYKNTSGFYRILAE